MAEIRSSATSVRGRTKLLTGTLYTALDRLLKQGLLQVDHEEVVAGKLRRCGDLECNGKNPDERNDRIGLYKNFAGLLGTDPGGNLSC